MAATIGLRLQSKPRTCGLGGASGAIWHVVRNTTCPFHSALFLTLSLFCFLSPLFYSPLSHSLLLSPPSLVNFHALSFSSSFFLSHSTISSRYSVTAKRPDENGINTESKYISIFWVRGQKSMWLRMRLVSDVRRTRENTPLARVSVSSSRGHGYYVCSG